MEGNVFFPVFSFSFPISQTQEIFLPLSEFALETLNADGEICCKNFYSNLPSYTSSPLSIFFYLKYNLQFMKHFLHICRDLADYMVPKSFCNSETDLDETPSLLTSCFPAANGNSTTIISHPWEAKREDSALPTPKYLWECFLLLSPPCRVEFPAIILVLIKIR